MSNIYISTPQLFSDDIDGLFNFNFAHTVNISNITVEYNYNITQSCVHYIEPHDDHTSLIDASYVFIQCDNPIALISNFVSMTINHAQLSISITPYEIEQLRQQSYGNYDYISLIYVKPPQSYGIISNQGELYITDMIINGLTIGRRMFLNYNILNMDRFQVIPPANYTPNALQSQTIIRQSRSSADISIHNSILIGGYNIIHIADGSLSVYHTTFQHGSGALEVQSANIIHISACIFLQVGKYSGNIRFSETTDYGGKSQILYIENVQQSIVIEDSHFSGYDDESHSLFLYVENSNRIILRNNFFVVDINELYYTIPADQLTMNSEEVYALLWFNKPNKYNSKLSIYGNNFYKNDVSPTHAWLLISGPYTETPCLSANNFSNNAILTEGSNITSCFREGLIQCMDNDCQHGEYGNINKQLFNKKTHFNIDMEAAISSFFSSPWDATPKFHAMDNIQINVFKNGQITTSENDTWSLIVSLANVLIMDSVLPPNVRILYPDTSNCSVINNDRFINDDKYVAKLLILCGKKYDAATMNLTEVSDVNYVQHLSATQIQFNSTSLTYYPGQKLQFDYKILDSLGHDIDINDYLFAVSDSERNSFIINVQNASLGFSQDIQIEQGGFCPSCESGVTIVSIGLYKNRQAHSIQTSLINDNLFLIDDNIHLKVISCPVSYGPDLDKYQCHLCPSGSYNLRPNNTDYCKSCNEDDNVALNCYNGEIYVHQDHWIGFVDDDYNNITAELCPSWYCCSDKKECNYQNESSLCAENRNPMVPLCGACMAGYSQAMNSTKCVKCDEHNYGYLILPFLLSICFTCYLIRCHPKKDIESIELAAANDGGCCFCKNMFNKSQDLFSNEFFLFLCKTLILRILIYYEQALSSILWPSSIASYSPYMYSVASLFNFEINMPDNNNTNMDQLWCFFNGLTSKGKILAGLIPSVMTICLLLIMFVLIRLCNCLKCQLHCESINCCKQDEHNRSPHVYRCCNTNYGKAFLALWIICVGQLLSVSFKILNCQHINNGTKMVHFYFGEEECSLQSWTVILSICFIILVVIVFSLMLIVLCKTNEDRREDPNYALNTLCKYYKTDCFWWEFIILLRRILITMYAILYRWPWYPIILITFLLCFIGAHYKYQPFKTKQANLIEYVALCATIIVIVIQITSMYIASITDFNQAATPILTLFIIVPIFCIFFYLMAILCHIKQDPKNANYVLYDRYSSVVANFGSPQPQMQVKSLKVTQIENETGMNCNEVTTLHTPPRHCNNNAVGSLINVDDDTSDEENAIEILPLRHTNLNISDRDLSIASILDMSTPNNKNNVLTTPLCVNHQQKSNSTHL